MNQTKFIDKLNWLPIFVEYFNKISNDKTIEVQNMFSYVKMPSFDDGKLVCFSKQVLQDVFGIEQIDNQQIEKFICGKLNPFIDNNYSMVYSGHQFGVWAGQLGDGRVINYGEIINKNQLWTIQIKGAGLTPYSRFADGNAVLRSTIREHLASEAMYNLGIPTTRSLGVVKRQYKVKRDILYNGNVQLESGSLNCRIAQSFIRIGNLQHLISKQDIDGAKKLLQFIINNYFKEFKDDKNNILILFEEITKRSAQLVAKWQAFGFVHGVLNTDNHSIYGLTIDYGPYGFMEKFDQDYTANSFGDHEGRYCYQNQPNIILWNLYQLANCLLPIIQQKEQVQNILNKYKSIFEDEIKNLFTKKFGFEYLSQDDFDGLYSITINMLQSEQFDVTLFFSELGRNTVIDNSYKCDIFNENFMKKTCYKENFNKNVLNNFEKLYLDLLQKYDVKEKNRQDTMNDINPAYILRNWFLQETVEQIDNDQYEMLNEVEEFILNPYKLNDKYNYYYQKTPQKYINKPKFDRLSCSSQLIFIHKKNY